MAGIVIIGASHAGLSCAEKLRQNGYEEAITIYERDSGWPFQRPPLSKTYLKAGGEQGDDAFLLRKPQWYDHFNITLTSEIEVASLHPSRSEIYLLDGQMVAYDHLILATGARPRRLPQKGAEAKGVFVLRTAEDARVMRNYLGNVRQAVIVGGGYIGLEAASSLIKLGIEVQIIEMAPRILARVASPPLSVFCADIHQKNGVRIHIGEGVDEILCDPQGACRAAALRGGGEIPAQLVLAGIGVVPDTVLAEVAGLHVDNGIIVNTDYQTKRANIWAIGDVARVPETSDIRIESIHHAQYSGAHVAACITGGRAPVKEAWWFWSDQYEVKFQMAGLLAAGAEGLTHVSRPGRKEGSVSIWTWRDDQLIAVEAANDPQGYMVGKRCLEAGIHPQRMQIENEEFALKSLLE